MLMYYLCKNDRLNFKNKSIIHFLTIMKQNVSTLSSWLKKETSLHPYFEEDKLIQVLSNQHKKQKAYFQTDQVFEQADRDGSKAFLPTQSPAWCFPPLYKITQGMDFHDI